MTKSIIVNVHEAKAKLSELLKRARAGEDVVIALRGKPVARLVPVREVGLPYGVWSDRIEVGPDFDEPLPSEIAEAFGT